MRVFAYLYLVLITLGAVLMLAGFVVSFSSEGFSQAPLRELRPLLTLVIWVVAGTLVYRRHVGGPRREKSRRLAEAKTELEKLSLEGKPFSDAVDLISARFPLKESARIRELPQRPGATLVSLQTGAFTVTLFVEETTVQGWLAE